MNASTSANQPRTRQQQNPMPDLPLPRSVLIRPARQSLSINRPLHKGPIKQAAGEGVDHSAAWEVCEDDVAPLPPFFPLERTHTVLDDTPCCVIAGRISECLRTESIHARFNEKQASALAETADHVHFNVRLFRDNQNPKRIFVEVQRRSGCGIKFHDACGAVLRAARGLPAKKATENRPLPPLPLVRVSSEEGIDDALELACGLLKKDRLDANVLGLESLRMLSDAKQSGRGMALCVSRKILSQGGDVSELIVSLVKFWKLHEEDDYPGTEESRRSKMMHNHALTVLANSLTLLSEAGESCSVLGSVCSDDGLLLALVQDLEDAEMRPHDSYQAARCLNVLSRATDRIRTRLQELGVLTTAQTCFNEGICKHAALACESEAMMRNLSKAIVCS